MKRFFNRKFAAFGTFALAATISTAASAQQLPASARGLPAPNLAPGQFVVSAQVVADTAVPTQTATGAATAHVGDLPASTVALRRGRSLVSSGSGCENGNCGSTDGVVDGGMISGGSVQGGCTGAGCQQRSYTQMAWGNMYTNGCNQANAQMYTSPVPVSPNVGHTYIPYQPFSPHHLLYKHTDRYHKYYDDGRGMNRTKAKYYYPPVRQAASNIYWNFLRIPR